MRISLAIDYWGPDVMTFDPEKVVYRFRQTMSTVSIDPRDYAQEEVEQLMMFLTKERIEGDRRDTMLRQIRGKAARNGPRYHFAFDQADGTRVTGQATRYHVDFSTDHIMDSHTEATILQFLQSLRVGELTCDTRTAHFCIADENHQGLWRLARVEDDCTNSSKAEQSIAPDAGVRGEN